jgi:hypothetical protein
MPRKRFNAFDDFPANGSDEVKVEPKPIPTSLPSEPPSVERIERLKPSQMLPDRFQPRRMLPSALRQPFFSGEMDCYTAAERWLSLAHNEPAFRAELDRLLAMGSSFEEHGQIKPITGTWAPSSDGRYIFLIETGERRFWAACLQKVQQNLSEEPLLRVEVVQRPTRQRQVLENRHAEPPSAVGQACEVASLILAELGVQPDPQVKDDFEYFRLARGQRMPTGLWDRIMPVMQLTRTRMVQLLNILQLPTPLLELADRHRLPERVLREVLSLPPAQWERMLRISIQNQLTSDEVVEAAAAQTAHTPAEKKDPPVAPDPVYKAASGLRRFANTINALDDFSQSQALDEIADKLVITGQAEGLLVYLDELSRLITARLSRR